MKLDKYKEILKNCKNDLETVASRKSEETNKARSEYNTNILQSKIDGINTKYSTMFQSVRDKYSSQLATATEEFKRKNQNIKDTIDYDLLAKLNTVSQASVELSADELEQFAKDALASRSSICIRKVQIMAKDNSNLKLTMPDERKAREIIDEVNKRCQSVITNYDGNPTINANSKNISVKMDANGTFIKSYESQYDQVTSSDIKITKYLAKDYQKIKEKEKSANERNATIEEVDASSVNVSATPVNKIQAAAYAKTYSDSFWNDLDVNPEFE